MKRDCITHSLFSFLCGFNNQDYEIVPIKHLYEGRLTLIETEKLEIAKQLNFRTLEHFEERNKNNDSIIRFRATMHLGMGTIYIVLGLIVIYVRAFGTMELSATFAYILSGFMVLYGAFRIWRGIADFRLMPKKDERKRNYPTLPGIDPDKK